MRLRNPGRVVAEWVVNDPRRSTLTPKTDVAFYTALYTLAFWLIVVAVVVILIDVVVA